MAKVKIAIVGVGNCASSLVQGVNFYNGDSSDCEPIGLMHRLIGGYAPGDVEIVCAFDIDRRKVGLDVADAIFAPPNCTARFCEGVQPTGATVAMGAILDGVSEHMAGYDASRTFVPSDAAQPTAAAVARRLRDSGAEVLVNYLPVGSERAARFYAQAAIDAGVGMVNCMPVFIASDPAWAGRFASAGLPILGDDIKAQFGATILHRALVDLFARRGVKLERTYQLNTGGNTDFLNMLNQQRLASKRTSKTEAVQAVAASRLPDEDIYVGPSDYVPWQKDNKVAFIRMEGLLFGEVPMNLELRLSVEDSPNSAGVAIDAIRCCKLARDRGLSGAIVGPSAFLMKHPPRQFPDGEAFRLTEAFIKGQ
ncbi:MAG: Inositol-3-phosphate synthase [Phycisphaerae bacterium]|nr:Inositol-3-phosphate synthase [Phycisphaerae bacterium]